MQNRDIQEVRTLLMAFNRVWRYTQTVHSDGPMFDELGQAFTDYTNMAVLKFKWKLDLRPVVLPGNTLYGFYSPDLATSEANTRLGVALTLVLQYRQPKGKYSIDTWCMLMDLLMHELMYEQDYTAMQQITEQQWNELIARSITLMQITTGGTPE